MRDFQLEQIERGLSDVRGMMIGLAKRQTGTPRGDTTYSNLIKGLTARMLAESYKVDVGEIIRLHYRDSTPVRAVAANAAEFHAKATTSPARTDLDQWAGELTTSANYPGLIAALTPSSVYSRLRLRGLMVTRGRAARINLPNRVRKQTLPTIWVAEADPIPVRDMDFDFGGSLIPKKAGLMTYWTTEMTRQSVPSFEAVMRQSLDEDFGSQIDTDLLGNGAGTASREAGLLNGLTPLAASAATSASDAAFEDIRAMLASFKPAAVDPVLICATTQAVTLGMLYPDLTLTVLTTDVLPDGRVIMLDGSDFATFSGEDAEVRTDRQGIIVPADDTTNPDWQGQPARSLWQEDKQALRILESLAWVMRRPGRVFYIDDVEW